MSPLSKSCLDDWPMLLNTEPKFKREDYVAQAQIFLVRRV